MAAPEHLHQALMEHDLVLTPNVRSARELQRLLLTAENSGQKVITILPWRAWTSLLWQQFVIDGANDRALMSEMQASVVWERTLAAAQPETIRPLRSLVQLCMSAHRLVGEYGATDRLQTQHTHDGSDAAVFAGWLRHFEAACTKERLISPAALEGALAGYLVHRGKVPGTQISSCLVYGFDRLLPSQRELLSALTSAQVTVVERQADVAMSAGPLLVAAATAENEYRHFAESMRTFLYQGVHRIAVIVPDLAKAQNAMERHLRRAIAPGSYDVQAGSTSVPWEFSEGRPLSSVTLVAHAMLLLRWLIQPLPVDDVSELLRSPYVDLHVDADSAARADATLLRDTRRLRPEWSMGAVASRVESSLPRLQTKLVALTAEASAALRGMKSYGEWSEVIALTLCGAGWPGTRERTSEEYQAVDRWHELLDALAALDLVDGPLNYPALLVRLQQTAQDTIFAPEHTGAPIQIMSVPESAGSTADVLWFLHADEERWNARRSIHPLLPFALQQELRMPGADAATDSLYAAALTDRLLRSAAQCTFSYAEQSENGDIRASSLVTSLPGLKWCTAAVAGNAETEPKLESFTDMEPLPALPYGTSVPGGVSVLQSQAACAFRAFAEKRLFSSDVSTGDLGFEARERGSTLHVALEHFWIETKDRQTLLKLQAEGQVDAALLRAIALALPSAPKGDAWAAAYLQVQRDRLLKLLRQWLAYEAGRPPFKVAATEQKVEVAVGPLRMRARVDRVDEVDDDGQTARVLVDYKTGMPDVKDWLGDRPSEPQLPVYATAAGIENVQAIAFGVVRPGKKYLGLKAFPANSKLLCAGKQEKDPFAFEAELESWQRTLESLAEQFASGTAAVDPKDYPFTCRYCAQRMFCRLNPELLPSLAEDEDEAEVPA